MNKGFSAMLNSGVCNSALALAGVGFDTGNDGGSGGGDGGGASGGSGGAANLLDDPPADDPNKGGADDPPADDPNKGGADDPPDMKWASGISEQKRDGEELSDREWLEKRGYKDFGKVVSDARGMEKLVRDKGAIKIPGEDAKPEEVQAFREAMGVPETAEGYEVKLPDVEGGDFKIELDTDFLGPLREVAHKHNVPGAAFQELASKVVDAQLEGMKADLVRADSERDQKVKDWGNEAAAKTIEFKRGAEILGLDKQSIATLQQGEGATSILMDMLSKVGSLAGEDFFEDGGGAGKFGVASEAEAQQELDRMTSDPEVQKKLKAKDGATKAQYNRLTEAVAHFRSLKAKK